MGLEGESGEKISGRRARRVVNSDALRAALGEVASERELLLLIGLMPLLASGEEVEGE